MFLNNITPISSYKILPKLNFPFDIVKLGEAYPSKQIVKLKSGKAYITK